METQKISIFNYLMLTNDYGVCLIQDCFVILACTERHSENAHLFLQAL